MSEDILNDVNSKLDIIITLLARAHFDVDYVKQIVTQRKRNPDDYVKGYNALDGTQTVSEIANIIGVTVSTLSPILQDWVGAGIIVQTEKRGGVYYRHYFPIPSKEV